MSYLMALWIAVIVGAVIGGFAGYQRNVRINKHSLSACVGWAMMLGAVTGALFGLGALLHGFFYFLSGPKPPEPLLEFSLVMALLMGVAIIFVPPRT